MMDKDNVGAKYSSCSKGNKLILNEMSDQEHGFRLPWMTCCTVGEHTWTSVVTEQKIGINTFTKYMEEAPSTHGYSKFREKSLVDFKCYNILSFKICRS